MIMNGFKKSIKPVSKNLKLSVPTLWMKTTTKETCRKHQDKLEI